MSIPVNPGDILITTEILRIRLGQVSRNRIENDILFNTPKGFIEIATEKLKDQSLTTTLFDVVRQTGEEIRDESGELYDLNAEIETSKQGFEMQWYVKGVKSGDEDDEDTYNLIAIGAGRTARIKDWEAILDIYRNIPISEETPTLEDFIFVEGVDSSFFDKKAVFRLNEAGELEPIVV